MKRYVILAVMLFTSCAPTPDFSNALRSETATMADSGVLITEYDDTETECVSCAVMSEDDTPIDDTYTVLFIYPEDGITAEDISDLLEEHELELIVDEGSITVKTKSISDEELEKLIISLEEDDMIRSVSISEK